MVGARAEMTVGEYVPLVMRLMAKSTARSWATYSQLLVDEFGTRKLSEVHPEEIEALAIRVEERALRRSVSRNGMGAREGFISCSRAVWNKALVGKLVSYNPAADVQKPPRRRAVQRRALTNDEVQAVWQALATRSTDAELACLVFRLALETGFRRGELLGLRVDSLDRTTPTIGTGQHAKMGSFRAQPITEDLWLGLREFVSARHGARPAAATQLLVNRRGEPITRRWFEHTADVVRRDNPQLGSANGVWFTWHLCRHTGATLVERQGGYAMARTFLGHAESDRGLGITLRYTTVSQEELRATINRVWGSSGFL